MTLLTNIFGDTCRVKLLSVMYQMTKDEEKIYIRKLVARTGYTPQTVTNHITELENRGLITRTKTDGSPTKYITVNPRILETFDTIEEIQV